MTKQWKVYSRAGKYNQYSGDFNNDNQNIVGSHKNDNSRLRLFYENVCASWPHSSYIATLRRIIILFRIAFSSPLSIFFYYWFHLWARKLLFFMENRIRIKLIEFMLAFNNVKILSSLVFDVSYDIIIHQ